MRAVSLVLPALLSAAEPHTLTALLDGTAFAKIPAGEFSMGSASGNPDEQPVRQVRIPAPFEIGKYEVSQAQWDSLMRDPHGQAKYENPSHFKGPSLPVENVSWRAVQIFIAALNARDLEHHYRLPSEAEWEYSAKADKADIGPLDKIAWHQANSQETTHPIGEKAPNAWGLYDMIGNVFEWVNDWYVPEPYANSPATEPQSATGSYKVYRGCSWHSEAKYCRSAYRGFDFPGQSQYSVGFRLVRTPRPQTP